MTSTPSTTTTVLQDVRPWGGVAVDLGITDGTITAVEPRSTTARHGDGATVVDLATLATYEIQIPGRPQVVVPLPEGPAA